MNMTKVLVEVVIFASLIGVIASQIGTAAADGNLSAAAAVLVGLVTLFVVIGFIAYIVKSTGAKR